MFRPPAAREQAPLSLRRRILSLPTLISLALAALFLVFLVTRFDIDLRDVWRQIAQSNPWLLALAFIVHYATFPFRGARWRLLLLNTRRQGETVPGVAYCSQLMLLSWFVNSVGWFRVGDAYRAYLYQQEQRQSFSRAIGTIVAERALDTALVVGLLALAAPFLLNRDGNLSLTVLGLAVALLGLLALGLAVIALTRNWLGRRLPAAIAARYQRFHEGALGSFGRLPWVAALGVLGWLAEVGRLWLVAQALGIPLALPLAVFAALANSLLTLVPTPGGLGAVESGVTGLLTHLSALSLSAAAALALLDRAISYLSVIITGAIVFLLRQSWRRKG